MKLWKISQNVNHDYDTYDSAVVAAETAIEAMHMNPGTEPDGRCFAPDSYWVSPERDMPDRDIEEFLLAQADWVKSKVLCERFQLRQRQLRALDGVPGMLSDFAVCSDKGYKHVARATTAEWLRFKHRIRRHGIGELIRVRNLARRRHDVLAVRSVFVAERDTGQGILFKEAVNQ